MKRWLLVAMTALLISTASAVGVGGFLAVTFGAVGAAMLPPDTAGELVGPWACPAGTRTDVEARKSQCNAHNRNSGTCHTLQIDCVDERGKLIERVDPNTSMLTLVGVCMGYAFLGFGPLVFLITFAGVFLTGGALKKGVDVLEARLKRSSTSPPAA